MIVLYSSKKYNAQAKCDVSLYTILADCCQVKHDLTRRLHLDGLTVAMEIL